MTKDKCSGLALSLHLNILQVIPLHPPPGDTSTERTLQIDGTNDQIEAAKVLVNEVINSEVCVCMQRNTAVCLICTCSCLLCSICIFFYVPFNHLY